MHLLDGKALAKEIRKELKEKISSLDEKPGLAVVLVGKNPASEQYVGMKKKMCRRVGIESFSYELSEKTTEQELIDLVKKLNEDKKVNGILVQLPLPGHIDSDRVLDCILPEKDVDGFHPVNMGRLIQNRECLRSCTPYGIIRLLKKNNIELEGKDAVVLGRSNIVGKPMAIMLMHENATVTICHSRTKNIKEICKKSDIIISAIGKAGFVTEDMVKPGTVVVDVGANFVDGKLCGDVDFENVSDKTSYITPVPGGVGPMTIATLLSNTFDAFVKAGSGL